MLFFVAPFAFSSITKEKKKQKKYEKDIISYVLYFSTNDQGKKCNLQ